MWNPADFSLTLCVVDCCGNAGDVEFGVRAQRTKLPTVSVPRQVGEGQAHSFSTLFRV